MCWLASKIKPKNSLICLLTLPHLDIFKPLVSSNYPSFSPSPAEDSTQQRGVEALRWGEASLHLPDRHLVLGGWAEQREATGDRTEDLRRVGHAPNAEALLTHGQGREGRAVQLGRDGDWAEVEGRKTQGLGEKPASGRSQQQRDGCKTKKKKRD